MSNPLLCSCGSETETDVQAQGFPAVGFRELSGPATTLREVRFHKSEVQQARKLFGNTGNLIGDDGRVRVKDSRDARDFFRRDHALRGQFADKKAATADRSK